jgi:hypothetical protein
LADRGYAEAINSDHAQTASHTDLLDYAVRFVNSRERQRLCRRCQQHQANNNKIVRADISLSFRPTHTLAPLSKKGESPKTAKTIERMPL